MAMKTKEVGKFEDPDLVPIMNLVCVLIPLVLFTATWIAFGQITVLRGAQGSASKAQRAEEQKKLRLVAILTKGSITLMASREIAAVVMPEDPTTGTKGRAEIPHQSLRISDIEKNMQTACPSPPDAKFDDCAYWGYMHKFVEICYSNAQGQVRVPDLKQFNMILRRIKEQAKQNFEDALDDVDQINIKSEDDIPYCQMIGLMDFGRFNEFAFDWSADKEFNNRVEELIRKGVTDPFLDPKQWNEAMRKALLFPIVGFVN